MWRRVQSGRPRRPPNIDLDELRDDRIRIAPNLLLAIIIAVSGVVASYGGLVAELAQVRSEISSIKDGSFSNKDFLKERALIQSEIERAQHESLILCQELAHLAKLVQKQIGLVCPVVTRHRSGG